MLLVPPSYDSPVVPIVPSSASTDTSETFATSTTFLVIAILSSYDICDASIITEVNPQRIARRISSNLPPWSRWITIGTLDLFASSIQVFIKLSPKNSSSVG